MLSEPVVVVDPPSSKSSSTAWKQNVEVGFRGRDVVFWVWVFVFLFGLYVGQVESLKP